MKKDHMDIFTKGYVDLTKNEETPEQELEKTQIKIEKLPILDEETKIEEKPNKRKSVNKKNILVIVGIIIEIVIIMLIIAFSKQTDNYKTIVKCSNTTEMEEYTIITNNTYYFDKKDNVAKNENEINYIFKEKEVYQDYKNNYISTDIDNYSGLEQSSAFDDVNYIYQNKITYDYNKLKKNKKVKFKNDKLTLKIKDRDDITLYIQDYDSVLTSNEEMGFICQ